MRKLVEQLVSRPYAGRFTVPAAGRSILGAASGPTGGIIVTTDTQARPARERRRQADRREESEHRLLEAATALIAEKGCTKMTLSEVGARAGYSTTLPVHYFKTKEALIAAVTDRISDHYSRYLESELQGVSGLPAVRTFIRTFIQHVVEFPVMRRAWFMILAEAAIEPELRDAVSRPRSSAIRDLSAFLRQAQRAGDLRKGLDVELQASMIHGALRGLIELWVVDPRAITLSKHAAAFGDFVLRSLER